MMITAKDLTKRYGKVAALNNVSFTIEAGESVALWGANGAGKTTTLRCLPWCSGFEGELSRQWHRRRP
ncbi:MAG: ATP-binding cassette domain-containing protein [Chloroflexi bacterium]|nr:ATP-binding cassette domain-containing protein [Chloroflexota bacterium]